MTMMGRPLRVVVVVVVVVVVWVWVRAGAPNDAARSCKEW
jgi:hypothetical protein